MHPELEKVITEIEKVIIGKRGVIEKILAALLAETERLRSRLNALPGLTAEPTRTHFFLCRLAKGRAAQLKDYLAREHGILIRDASNFEGLDAGHFRIATQTPAENDILVDAIRQYLGEGPAK